VRFPRIGITHAVNGMFRFCWTSHSAAITLFLCYCRGQNARTDVLTWLKDTATLTQQKYPCCAGSISAQLAHACTASTRAQPKSITVAQAQILLPQAALAFAQSRSVSLAIPILGPPRYLSSHPRRFCQMSSLRDPYSSLFLGPSLKNA
jgi:hypothetical protein